MGKGRGVEGARGDDGGASRGDVYGHDLVVVDIQGVAPRAQAASTFTYTHGFRSWRCESIRGGVTSHLGPIGELRHAPDAELQGRQVENAEERGVADISGVEHIAGGCVVGWDQGSVNGVEPAPWSM